MSIHPLLNPAYMYIVELQWLERLWDHRNLFETWVVRATEVNHSARSEGK